MSEKFVKNLPEKFVKNTLEVCGNSVELWLNDLPQIIEGLSEKWQIKAEKSFENLSYNFVALCVCADGSKAVLKIAPPLYDSLKSKKNCPRKTRKIRNKDLVK